MCWEALTKLAYWQGRGHEAQPTRPQIGNMFGRKTLFYIAINSFGIIIYLHYASLIWSPCGKRFVWRPWRSNNLDRFRFSFFVIFFYHKFFHICFDSCSSRLTQEVDLLFCGRWRDFWLVCGSRIRPPPSIRRKLGANGYARAKELKGTLD